LTVTDDHSVRLGGEIANQDTHRVTVPVTDDLASADFRTLRLDAFPDPETDRVGVSSNGNVVLSEITIETRGDVSGPWQPLEIASATADIEQDGGPFAVAGAIDGQVDDKTGWAVAGHEQPGSRTAWFEIPGLVERLREGAAELRITLNYQSVYAKHQFRRVRFTLSESPASVAPENRIEPGPLHLAGPFPVEAAAAAYARSFASQGKAFDAKETFSYRDQTFDWNPRPEFTPVAVHPLPTVSDGASVNVIHQSIRSPNKQSVTLLLGTTDGHDVFLNGKRVAQTQRTGPLRPLANRYTLQLRKGSNDLYVKVITGRAPARWTFAYRSPAVALPQQVIELADKPVDQRSDAEQQSLTQYYRQAVCEHPEWTALQDAVAGAVKAKEKIRESIPTTLVWKELDQPRQAHLLLRGQYDNPGQEVPRATPSFLPAMPDDVPNNRLGLARWLTDRRHPLTARVAVNRFWQSLFGQGLVKSSEDFGNQGQMPSHPRLLDYLAVDFQESGWNVKRLIRQIVTSDAYRRSARVTQAAAKLDPENRFYARGPRYRLDAEVLRDQALALAGLLEEDFGGPSVKPPQPKGLWYAVGYTRSNTANFTADEDPGKVFRRSVYIFWKRTSAPPQMSTFDAPSRESCTARRERTNTPLQALVLMNETQYLQAAKHRAMRTLRQCDGRDPASRARWMFETVTARQPHAREHDELVSLADSMLEHYRGNRAAAAELLAVDDSTLDRVGEPTLAAWMVVASTLLNLDEVINK